MPSAAALLQAISCALVLPAALNMTANKLGDAFMPIVVSGFGTRAKLTPFWSKMEIVRLPPTGRQKHARLSAGIEDLASFPIGNDDR